MDGNGETTMFYVMIRNHPIETTIHNWMFQVPGIYWSMNGWLLVDLYGIFVAKSIGKQKPTGLLPEGSQKMILWEMNQNFT